MQFVSAAAFRRQKEDSLKAIHRPASGLLRSLKVRQSVLIPIAPELTLRKDRIIFEMTTFATIFVRDRQEHPCILTLESWILPRAYQPRMPSSRFGHATPKEYIPDSLTLVRYRRQVLAEEAVAPVVEAVAPVVEWKFQRRLIRTTSFAGDTRPMLMGL